MAVTTINEFVAYILGTHAQIKVLVGNRIFHGNIPETITTKPVINYMIVSKPRSAVTDVYRVHYQINVRSTTPAQAWLIAGYVIDCFDNYQDTADGFDVQAGYYDNSRILTEPNNVYVVPLDIYLTYKGA